MQYKVPQNIDKPDQIIGPLTLVEFSYLAIAGALDLLVYQTIKGLSGYLVIGIISIVAAAFAFLKVQERPLMYFILATIDFLTRPKTRVWHKVSDRPIIQNSQTEEKLIKTPSKTFDPERLEKAAENVDSASQDTVSKPAMPFKNVDQSTLENQQNK